MLCAQITLHDPLKMAQWERDIVKRQCFIPLPNGLSLGQFGCTKAELLAALEASDSEDEQEQGIKDMSINP